MSAHVAVLGLAVGLLAVGLARAQDTPDVGATERTRERLGLQFDGSEQMTIESEELEAAPDEQGRDRVIFRRDVRVVQGAMTLHCDWLEAIYPPRAPGEASSGGKPERITARGEVRILQGGDEAICSEAVFNNQACSAECVRPGGKAELRRNADVIEADAIVFDLCKGILKARGGVRIVTQRRQEETSE